ncbi:MAG: hypothetical protein ACYS0H_22525, partial [Planctomycetota bacterium]
MNCKIRLAILGVAFACCGVRPAQCAIRNTTEQGEFKVPGLWECTAPLIAPEKRRSNPSRAQKDPTVVFCGGKWHVFMTVKLPGKSAIEYCSFGQWDRAD